MPSNENGRDAEEIVHDHPGGQAPHQHGGAMPAAAAQETQTVQLREEEIVARKQSVEAGRVEVGKEVVTERRSMEVPVSHDEVIVDRHAVARRPADGPIGDATNATISVPITEEEVSLEKRAVVYEEVGIGKQSVQETKEVSGTVRREEARVETEGDTNLHAHK